jgi:hypothetical protein
MDCVSEGMTYSLLFVMVIMIMAFRLIVMVIVFTGRFIMVMMRYDAMNQRKRVRQKAQQYHRSL